MYYEVRVNLLRQRTSKNYPLRQRWNWSAPTLLSDKKQRRTNLPRNCWNVTKALNRIWKNSMHCWKSLRARKTVPWWLSLIRKVLLVMRRGITPAQFGASNRKSTRLNSSHVKISYAVFCLKKKNEHKQQVVDTDDS